MTLFRSRGCTSGLKASSPHLRESGLDAGQVDDGPVDLLDLHGELVDRDLQLLALLDQHRLKVERCVGGRGNGGLVGKAICRWQGFRIKGPENSTLFAFIGL